jgi:uncharacterized membrane protein
MQDETERSGSGNQATSGDCPHPNPPPFWGRESIDSPPPAGGRDREGAASDDCPPRDSERPLFQALLYPHRSLPAHGYVILIGGTAVIAAVYGVMFLFLGAWPIFGFIGAEWLLFWWLLRTHLKGERRAERIRLFRDRLVLQQLDAKGRVAECSFEPYWLQIVLYERGFENPALLLRSHGRSVEIGAFLGAHERRQFADELTQVLARWRNA